MSSKSELKTDQKILYLLRLSRNVYSFARKLVGVNQKCSD